MGTSTPALPVNNFGTQKPLQKPHPDLDMSLKLSTKQRERWGLEFQRKITEATQARTMHDDRIREWRDQYDSVSYPKNWPWPNAANLNIPTTRSAVDTIHARLLHSTTDVQPLFRCEASAPDMTEAASQVEGVLQFQAVDQMELPAVLDPIYQAGLRDGCGIGMLTWEKTIARIRRPDVQVVNGQQIPVLIEEDDYVVNQPVLEDVDVLDFWMYPANAKSINKAIGVGRRVWRTQNDLMQGVKDGLYSQADIDALLKANPEQPQADNDMKGGDSSRVAAVGLEDAEPLDDEDRSYEFMEFIWKYDADGDGIKEHCWFELELSTGILIRYEQYPFWHGQRCFLDWTPYPRPKSFYGYSLPEILEDLHAEINAIRNQRVDAGTLMLMPMMLKRRGVRFDPTKQRLFPGIVIECDDPAADMKPFSFQAVTQNAFAEEQKAAEMAEQVTGANSYSQGQSPSRSRTAGEVNSVEQGSNTKFDVIVKRMQKTNTRLAQMMLGLNRQYLTAEVEYSITDSKSGDRVFQTIAPEQIATRVRIVAQGNALNNRELKLQSAETLFQMMPNEPLLQKPTRRYAVLANYLHAMGVTNIIPFIGSEADALEAEQQPDGPPPPEPPQVSGKMDEALTLARMIDDGQITPEKYLSAAKLVAEAAAAAAAAGIPPVQPGQPGRAFPPAKGAASKRPPVAQAV